MLKLCLQSSVFFLILKKHKTIQTTKPLQFGITAESLPLTFAVMHIFSKTWLCIGRHGSVFMVFSALNLNV